MYMLIMSHNGMASVKLITSQTRTIFQYKNTSQEPLSYST